MWPYFLRLAEEAESGLWGPQQVVWLERLEREHDNLRAALQWLVDQGRAELAARLAGALWRFWEAHNYLSEGRRWLETTLTMVNRVSHSLPEKRASVSIELRIKALNGAGILANDQGEYPCARELLEASLLLCRALGDKHGIATTLNHLAAVAWFQADHARHRAISEECYQLYHETGRSARHRQVARRFRRCGLDAR